MYCCLLRLGIPSVLAKKDILLELSVEEFCDVVKNRRMRMVHGVAV